MNGKVIISFLLGIIVTAVIILPKSNQNELAATPEPAPITVTAQTTPEPFKTLEYEESAEAPKVEEIAAEQAVEVKEEETTVEVTPEPTPSPEPKKVEVKAETTPKQTSSPQVKKTEPEYFYEDGKKYAYINGFKSLITDEPDVQIDSYDWENDPAGQITGPFN